MRAAPRVWDSISNRKLKKQSLKFRRARRVGRRTNTLDFGNTSLSGSRLQCSTWRWRTVFGLLRLRMVVAAPTIGRDADASTGPNIESTEPPLSLADLLRTGEFERLSGRRGGVDSGGRSLVSLGKELISTMCTINGSLQSV